MDPLNHTALGDSKHCNTETEEGILHPAGCRLLFQSMLCIDQTRLADAQTTSSLLSLILFYASPWCQAHDHVGWKDLSRAPCFS